MDNIDEKCDMIRDMNKKCDMTKNQNKKCDMIRDMNGFFSILALKGIGALTRLLKRLRICAFCQRGVFCDGIIG